MQFKKVGRRVQVLRYDGYDKAKKRAIVKMLGSLDLWHDYEPTVGLIESLTSLEKEEVQSYILLKRLCAEEIKRLSALNLIDSYIKMAADCIEDGLHADAPAEWAEKTWAAIDRLTKAMRKAGYSRPSKKSDSRSVEKDDRQTDFVTAP